MAVPRGEVKRPALLRSGQKDRAAVPGGKAAQHHGVKDMLLLQQKLARNIGLDVSRLFYDWAPDEPGTRFEDK